MKDAIGKGYSFLSKVQGQQLNKITFEKTKIELFLYEILLIVCNLLY